MFEKSSRYFNIEDATLNVKEPNGETREIAYKLRRFVPPAEEMTTILEHIVIQGDRLDNVTARYLGDPTQFWRVADANNAMRPEELTDNIGGRIKVAFPK